MFHAMEKHGCKFLRISLVDDFQSPWRWEVIRKVTWQRWCPELIDLFLDKSIIIDKGMGSLKINELPDVGVQ